MLYIVHLMRQEFLVAVHLRLFTRKEEFTSVPNDKQRSILTELKSKKYEMFRRSDKRSRYHCQNNLAQKSGWIFRHVKKICK